MKIAVRQQIRTGGLAVAAMLLLSGMQASALIGYSKAGKLNVVSEPGQTNSAYVQYYKDGKAQSLDKLTWSDNGRNGKAVVLDGKSEYLQVGYNQLKVSHLSFSAWVYWKGAASDAENARYGQRIFTMSRGVNSYLTLSPQMRDTSRTDAQGGILDGIYLGFRRGSDTQKNLVIERWNPAVRDQETFALPTGEWHHVAVVNDGRTLRLYLDGKVWFEDTLIMGMAEMQASKMMIGSGLWEDPTLNAMLDEVALYSFALSEAQVKLLAAGVDPQAQGATLPPATAPYQPTQPTQTVAPGISTPPAEVSPTLFGLPVWTVIVIAAIVLLFVTLSVVLSLTQGKGGGTKGVKGKRGDGR